MQVQFGPQINTFHAEDLEQHVNTLSNGKRRKQPIKDLTKDCQLLQLPAYNCDVIKQGGERIVECKKFLRLFRKYVVSCSYPIACLAL